MAPEIDRRDFLASAPAAMYLAGTAFNTSHASPPAAAGSAKIEPFDYQGVTLRASRWKAQADAGREFYLGLSNDDILCGDRKAAGLPAPGQVLGGWAARNSNAILGQWMSGMARLSRATGDARLRDKAVTLFERVEQDRQGRWRRRHAGTTPFDKTRLRPGRSADLRELRAGGRAAREGSRIYASKTLDRANKLADPTHNTAYYGVPQEWYTLAENLCRAYQLTGNTKFKTFARGLALSRLVEQVRAHIRAGRRARRPRLQPRQHLQQRRDGLRRPRRRRRISRS